MRKLFFSILLMLLVPMVAGAQEAYAVLSSDNRVLTFYYDDQKTVRNGMDVGSFSDQSNDFPSWFGRRESITSVVFDNSFAACTTLTSTSYWFYGFQNLSTFTGISNLKTDKVTNMRSMFFGCSSLTSLDLSSFKTDNVTNMSYMFEGCSGLTSLDLSGFNTENVTNMLSMFYNCSSLTSLDLSGFNTDNVTNMCSMFYGCWYLTSLDLSSFKTDNVTDMSGMFFGCSGLTTIYAGDGWSTAKVQGGSGMFIGNTNLVGGAGTPYDDDHTDYTYAHIDGGSDNPGYFTAKGGAQQPDAAEPYAVLSDDNRVLTFYYDDQKAERNGMDIRPFWGYYDDYPAWYDQRESITSVVFDNSFAGCTTLTSTAYWFYGFQNLSTFTGISNLQTDNVTDMSNMFSGCSGLTSLDLTGLKTDNVIIMDEMFYGCSGLTSLDLTGFKTDNVEYMGSMFVGCRGLTSLDLTSFKTDNVGGMSWMFAGCSGLTTIYAGEGWSTAKVQLGSGMFNDCYNLVGGAGTPFDADHTDHTYAHIDGGSDNPGYFTAKAGGTEEWTKYDLNGDGKVDASDVVMLVNFIMNQK